MENLIKVARRIVDECLELTAFERVALVKDHDSRIIDAFENVLDNYDLVEISSNRSNSSPIPEAVEAFSHCDVIIAPTKYSITHCSETTAARKKGVRAVTLPGITEELFLKILDADVDEIARLNDYLYDQLKTVKEVHITSSSGTDIVIALEPKREWKRSGMKCVHPGESANLPNGEIYCAPLETQANGVIVIDRWDSIVASNHAQVTVENGRITRWNAAAKPYVDRLKTGGENGLTIAELGIGTNKGHIEPVGNILHDEKIYGSCHIAFGQNTSFGGINRAGVHEDLIIMHPTILLDGKKLNY